MLTFYTDWSMLVVRGRNHRHLGLEKTVDLNTLFSIEHHDAFVAARLNSARYYSQGTGSPVVAIIGGVASALRRAAARIETWSRGDSDQPIPQRHVSAR